MRKSSIYCKARLACAAKNSSKRYLETPDPAANELHIHPDTLARYEKDEDSVPPDMIRAMARLYDAPELVANYCHNKCVLGEELWGNLDLGTPLERGCVQLSIVERDFKVLVNVAQDITQDGRITPDEYSKSRELVRRLAQLNKVANEGMLSVMQAMGPAWFQSTPR